MTMTKAEKAMAIQNAWATYRLGAQKIPNLPWDEYLGRDELLWRAYLKAEREILTAPVKQEQP